MTWNNQKRYHQENIKAPVGSFYLETIQGISLNTENRQKWLHMAAFFLQQPKRWNIVDPLSVCFSLRLGRLRSLKRRSRCSLMESISVQMRLRAKITGSKYLAQRNKCGGNFCLQKSLITLKLGDFFESMKSSAPGWLLQILGIARHVLSHSNILFRTRHDREKRCMRMAIFAHHQKSHGAMVTMCIYVYIGRETSIS